MGKYKDTKIIFIVEESPEGGYEARSLQHSVFTKSRYLRRTQKRWCVMRYPAISKPGPAQPYQTAPGKRRTDGCMKLPAD